MYVRPAGVNKEAERHALETSYLEADKGTILQKWKRDSSAKRDPEEFDRLLGFEARIVAELLPQTGGEAAAPAVAAPAGAAEAPGNAGPEEALEDEEEDDVFDHNAIGIDDENIEPALRDEELEALIGSEVGASAIHDAEGDLGVLGWSSAHALAVGAAAGAAPAPSTPTDGMGVAVVEADGADAGVAPAPSTPTTGMGDAVVEAEQPGASSAHTVPNEGREAKRLRIEQMKRELADEEAEYTAMTSDPVKLEPGRPEEVSRGLTEFATSTADMPSCNSDSPPMVKRGIAQLAAPSPLPSFSRDDFQGTIDIEDSDWRRCGQVGVWHLRSFLDNG